MLNRGPRPGTDGLPPGSVKSKNKPNWDAYDSWGGMLPFNRDRIYQGSVEAAAFRKLLNLWTWRTNDAVARGHRAAAAATARRVVPHAITRATTGGANDGHINFGFDALPPVLTEPAPAVTVPSSQLPIRSTASLALERSPPSLRGGTFLTLHDSVSPGSDEGRGVQLFDLLGGADGNVNQQRIADELIGHRFATGSVPIDVRAVALAITQGCITVTGTDRRDTQTVTSDGRDSPADLAFFDARHGINASTTLRRHATTRVESYTPQS